MDHQDDNSQGASLTVEGAISVGEGMDLHFNSFQGSNEEVAR